MKILGLEFSSVQRSAAFLDTASPDSSSVARADASSGGFDGFALIKMVLKTAQVTPEDVDLIAIGLGPGSYTGIRSAISIAQGWQLARGCRTVGLSSVVCLAAQAFKLGLGSRVHVVIDAQREEFYLATYQLDGAAAELVAPLHLVPLTEVQGLATAGHDLVGPDARRCSPRAHEMFPDAAVLAALAAREQGNVQADLLEPIYLRPDGFVKAKPSGT